MSTSLAYDLFSPINHREKNMTTSESIRKGIKRRVADLNTSMRRTAKSAGLAEQTIHNFVSGRTDILMNTLARYCEDGLDMTLDEIIGLGQK